VSIFKGFCAAVAMGFALLNPSYALRVAR
jgi:hypothetical protein